LAAHWRANIEDSRRRHRDDGHLEIARDVKHGSVCRHTLDLFGRGIDRIDGAAETGGHQVVE